jgi:hypothetical protein
VLKTAFYFIRSATTGFTASVFPYQSRVSLKEAFAGLELCAWKHACTVLRGLGPSNGVRLLGSEYTSSATRPLRCLLYQNHSDHGLARSPQMFVSVVSPKEPKMLRGFAVSTEASGFSVMG